MLLTSYIFKLVIGDFLFNILARLVDFLPDTLTVIQPYLYLGQNTELNGSGNLTATSTAGHGLLFNWLYMTLNVNGKLMFKGKKDGFYGSMAAYEELRLKKAGSKSDYYFAGDEHAMSRITSLKLTDMDFYYARNYGTPGCYFDQENYLVKQNGGVIVKGSDKWVNFYRVNEWYGIKVANVEINECNKNAIGSKYITGGGATAVSYDSNTKTLKLNNATIDTGSNNCALKYSNHSDGITINVTGNSEFKKPSGWVTTYLGGNTTITGSGTLAVNGELSIPEEYNLTLKDVNIVAGAIRASSSNISKLYVNLTTAGKRISAEDGVYGWYNIYLQDGTKVVEPAGARLSDDETEVVTSSGARATNVVLGDKTVTGIDGIETDANAEVIGIFDAQGRQLNEMQPGLNIIRMSDGTSRKVMVK